MSVAIEKVISAVTGQLDTFVTSLTHIGQELTDEISTLYHCCHSAVNTLRQVITMTVELIPHLEMHTKTYAAHLISLQRLASIVSTTFGLIKYVVLTIIVQTTATAKSAINLVSGNHVTDTVEEAGNKIEGETGAAEQLYETENGDTKNNEVDFFKMIDTKVTSTGKIQSRLRVGQVEAAVIQLEDELNQFHRQVQYAVRNQIENPPLGEADRKELEGQLKVMAELIAKDKDSLEQSFVRISRTRADLEYLSVLIQTVKTNLIANHKGQGKVTYDEREAFGRPETRRDAESVDGNLLGLVRAALAKLEEEMGKLRQLVDDLIKQPAPATDTESKEARGQLKDIGKKIESSKGSIHDCFSKVCKTRVALENQIRPLLDDADFEKSGKILELLGIHVETKEVNLVFLVDNVNPIDSLVKGFKGLKGLKGTLRKSISRTEASGTP